MKNFCSSAGGTYFTTTSSTPGCMNLPPSLNLSLKAVATTLGAPNANDFTN